MSGSKDAVTSFVQQDPRKHEAGLDAGAVFELQQKFLQVGLV